MAFEITDPIHGGIDVSIVEQLVRHLKFQRLNRIKQLGVLQMVYPSATHTRFSHSIGVFYITQYRVTQLVSEGLITPEEALATMVVALLHDIGHRPYSHLVETIMGSHDKRGLHLMTNDLRSVIESMGVNIELMIQIADRKHALSSIIYHTPLGADKLDYLVRDQYFTSGGFFNFRDHYRIHVGWNNENGLYLHSRGLVDFLQLMDTYWSLFAKMYQRVSGRVASRYLQELIRLSIDEIPHLRTQIDEGGEDEVMGAISEWSTNHPGHQIAERYTHFTARDHPRKGLLFAVRPELMATRPGEVQVALGCDTRLIEQSRTWNEFKLSDIETKLCAALNIFPWEISLTRAPSARRWDVPTLNVMVTGNRLIPIADLLPELLPTAEKFAQIAGSIVVSFTEKLRHRLCGDVGAQNAVRTILESS